MTTRLTTALASVIRCTGCGYAAAPDEPFPFRCPRAGGDDVDHLLARVLTIPRLRFPRGTEQNPFLRYRALMHSCQLATAHGLADVAYRDLVARLDTSVAAVDGHGFGVTPFFRAGQLSDALGFTAAGGVWIKDETGNVSGSHKGRHLMGLLIHLAVMEECGLLDRARRRELAIASCGNAALAAAVTARAGGWRLTVFVPPDASPAVLTRLRELGASLVICPREPGVPGDPAYRRLREALDRGALPFTVQGNENGLAVEGGLTMGYELVQQLADGPGELDHLIVQVGGGALASACIQALGEARALGALAAMPRVHTVQTASAHPLERAYHRVRALISHPDPSPGAIRQVMAHAAAHRSAFMWPWETEPKSIAAGILDDETYDWRAVVEGMLLTGGQPLAVDDELLTAANHLAVTRTGVSADPTGSAGLAGLLALRKSGTITVGDRVAVLFTGVQRG